MVHIMNELEIKIKDFIEIFYCCIYTNDITVKITKDDYTVEIPLSSYDVPMTISMQTQDEDVFFDYVCEEISLKRLTEIKFLTIKRVENED